MKNLTIKIRRGAVMPSHDNIFQQVSNDVWQFSIVNLVVFNRSKIRGPIVDPINEYIRCKLK